MKAKIVNYRGGLVQFKIPESWTEEIEETNGGTFYEDSPDSGTLRLEVLTYKNENGLSSEMVKSLIAKNGYESHGGDLAIQESTDRTEEDGENITIYYWKVGSPFGTNELNIFCFSYTILTSQEAIESFKNEVMFIGSEVKNAIYHRG